MKKTHYLLIIFCSLHSILFGQNYSTQNSVHIFWQPDLKITYYDYKGEQDERVKKLMDEYGFSASASVGIWSILDTPKKIKDRYKKFEKVYFAPAFERTTSFALENDSLQIAMQNTYLDICEICARWARKQLSDLQNEMNATGTLTVFYTTVTDDMNKLRIEMFRSYFEDVFKNKQEGAFKKWRKK